MQLNVERLLNFGFKIELNKSTYHFASQLA